MQTAGSNTVALCMDGKMMREKLVQVLERGKESATQIRRQIDHQDDHDHHDSRQLDAYSLDVLTSFATALSMIHYSFPSFNDDHDHQAPKRPNPTLKSQVFEEWEAPNTPRNARGSYKRRKTEEAVEIETQNTDDGYAWRKYGQKSIQHTKHPRDYYRCTHKTEQGCRATKQVQQISDNPPKYKIVYYGLHTCKNPLKTSPMYLDLIDDQDNSSSLLSFEKPSNPTNHGLNPFMLPPSSSSSSSTTSAAPMSNATVVQESTPIEDEIPLKPVDEHHGVHIQCPSSSNCLSTSYDLTNTSFVSDDFISLAEIYSPAVSPYGVEEDYSYMMAESCDPSEVFQDTYLLSARRRS